MTVKFVIEEHETDGHHALAQLDMNKPRTLTELASAMEQPMSHQEADKLLIESLQSLMFHRTLNPQQRDTIQKMLMLYHAKLTTQGQLALFGA